MGASHFHNTKYVMCLMSPQARIATGEVNGSIFLK
jgi:hypothetical protein